MNKKGFTIIELLIVIAILGILATLIFGWLCENAINAEYEENSYVQVDVVKSLYKYNIVMRIDNGATITGYHTNALVVANDKHILRFYKSDNDGDSFQELQMDVNTFQPIIHTPLKVSCTITGKVIFIEKIQGAWVDDKQGVHEQINKLNDIVL